MKVTKILIVENEMITQMFLSRTLTKAGFEVIGGAANYEQVIELIKQNIPDVILMDIGLPGDKDGVDISKIIKEKYNIPIIFLTGNSDKYTIERAKEVYPIGIIIKPIDESELINKLTSIQV